MSKRPLTKVLKAARDALGREFQKSSTTDAVAAVHPDYIVPDIPDEWMDASDEDEDYATTLGVSPGIMEDPTERGADRIAVRIEPTGAVD